MVEITTRASIIAPVIINGVYVTAFMSSRSIPACALKASLSFGTKRNDNGTNKIIIALVKVEKIDVAILKRIFFLLKIVPKIEIPQITGTA